MDEPVKVSMTLAEFTEFDADPRPVPVKASEKAGVSPDIVDNITLTRSDDGTGIEMTVIMREPRSQQEAQARGELSDAPQGRNPNVQPATPAMQGMPQEVHQFASPTEAEDKSATQDKDDKDEQSSGRRSSRNKE